MATITEEQKKQIIAKVEEWVRRKEQSDKTIFISEEVFKVFGEKDNGILNPWNNSTYDGLYYFLRDLLDVLKYEENIEDLREMVNGRIEAAIYNNDLLKFISENSLNSCYADDVLSEGFKGSFFELLQQAHYRFLDDIYNNATTILFKYFNLEE
jgi:calcineurin-like phosphoesterase family protein